MKMFYTDPLAAAYMAREFGVEIVGAFEKLVPEQEKIFILQIPFREWFEILLDSRNMRINQGYRKPDRYYVNDDSLPVFEPKVGDVGHNGEQAGDFRDKGFFETDEGLEVDKCKIIQRDGKPFFWPEVENDAG